MPRIINDWFAILHRVIREKSDNHYSHNVSYATFMYTNNYEGFLLCSRYNGI